MSNRPETGAMEFENDWCGIFVRGDNAMMLYANQLQVVLELNKDKLDAYSKSVIEGTIRLFCEANHHQDNKNKQLMKSFDECIKKESL